MCSVTTCPPNARQCWGTKLCTYSVARSYSLRRSANPKGAIAVCCPQQESRLDAGNDPCYPVAQCRLPRSNAAEQRPSRSPIIRRVFIAQRTTPPDVVRRYRRTTWLTGWRDQGSKEMIAWYRTVFGAHIVPENPKLAFLPWDKESHRLALVKVPRLLRYLFPLARLRRRSSQSTISALPSVVGTVCRRTTDSRKPVSPRSGR